MALDVAHVTSKHADVFISGGPSSVTWPSFRHADVLHYQDFEKKVHIGCK